MTCEKCQDGAWQRDFESDLKWGAGLANSTLRCVRYELPRWAMRIPLMADSDSISIADSVPGDGGHVARVS